MRSSVVMRTARVMQAEGIFDIPPSGRSGEEWQVSFELPAEWNIGVIVGPSGSGKTTIAHELYGDSLVSGWDWPADKSVLDGFPASMGIKDIIELLSSVGFSSPPSWVRPFGVLSNGEQFRVNMARTLAERPALSVVDEFTSVVDRTVAQIGSAAIAKTVRRRNQKFIAVTCHYDVLDWLEPDWVYEPATNQLRAGRSLWRRPTITLKVQRVHYSAWKLFGKYHYLDSTINKAALCYCAFWNDVPVAFCCALSFPHAIRPGWRLHRLVVLPDYQGAGIGAVLSDYVSALLKSSGKPVTRVAAHPSVVATCAKSKNWEMKSGPQMATKWGGKKASGKSISPTKARSRLSASFEYVGPALAAEEARRVWDGA